MQSVAKRCVPFHPRISGGARGPEFKSRRSDQHFRVRSSRFWRAGPLRNAQVVLRLQVQPRLRIAPEVSGEPHGRVGRNTAPLANDVVDTRSGYTQGLGQGVRRQTRRAQKVLAEYLTRVNRAHAVLEVHGPGSLQRLSPGETR